ncbi:MAG: LysR family transcriptional regulator [Gemmobacter sp.]|jgi:LysR family nitrogen assimilation transcriptional regulator|nr:LysR family transcriptional regulator [Gemmobacter sp.]
MGRIDRTGVDIRRLRYFLAVCDHGGFSRAAVAVGIAQPALTRQMQLLEQELGVELFNRNGRSATPSEAGQVLLARVRGHLDELDKVLDRLRHDFAATPRHLALGICPTIAPLFLEPVQEAMRALPGAPALEVIEAYSGDLRSLMVAGRLDLALSYATAAADGVSETPLLNEDLVLAAWSLPLRRPVALAEVAGLRLILPSRIHQLRRIIDASFAARGLPLSPALELDSLTAVKAMISDEAGGYATILPRNSVARDAAEGRFSLSGINDPGMVRTIALLRPPEAGKPVPPALLKRIAQEADNLRAGAEVPG